MTVKHKPTNRPSSESKRSSSLGQQTPHSSWMPKVHHRAHNSPPLVPTLRKTNPANALPFLKNLFNVIHHSHLGLPSRHFPPYFEGKSWVTTTSKRIFEKRDGGKGGGLNRSGSGYWQMVGSCECGNEHSGFIQCGEFLY